MSDSLLRITIDGLNEANENMRARAERLRSQLSAPLGRAGDLTVIAAQNRIKAEGPGWIRSKRAIRQGGTTGYDTGTMYGSIRTEQVEASSFNGRARVGVSGPAGKYAVIFQRGSGARGGGEAFRVSQPARTWRSRGRTFHARGSEYMHGGQPPRPFLYFDETLRERIRRVFADFAIGRPEADIP